MHGTKQTGEVSSSGFEIYFYCNLVSSGFEIYCNSDSYLFIFHGFLSVRGDGDQFRPRRSHGSESLRSGVLAPFEGKGK